MEYEKIKPPANLPTILPLLIGETGAVPSLLHYPKVKIKSQGENLIGLGDSYISLANLYYMPLIILIQVFIMLMKYLTNFI